MYKKMFILIVSFYASLSGMFEQLKKPHNPYSEYLHLPEEECRKEQKTHERCEKDRHLACKKSLDYSRHGDPRLRLHISPKTVNKKDRSGLSHLDRLLLGHAPKENKIALGCYLITLGINFFSQAPGHHSAFNRIIKTGYPILFHHIVDILPIDEYPYAIERLYYYWDQTTEPSYEYQEAMQEMIAIMKSYVQHIGTRRKTLNGNDFYFIKRRCECLMDKLTKKTPPKPTISPTPSIEEASDTED